MPDGSWQVPDQGRELRKRQASQVAMKLLHTYTPQAERRFWEAWFKRIECASPPAALLPLHHPHGHHCHHPHGGQQPTTTAWHEWGLGVLGVVRWAVQTIKLELACWSPGAASCRIPACSQLGRRRKMAPVIFDVVDLSEP